MLILAFDTATDRTTIALVADGAVLGERTTTPQSLLAAVDALLAEARVAPSDLSGIVVGTGPGSFTGTRIGLAAARGLALSLGIEVAGVSTLDALAAACEGAYPVIDAKRGEVFVTGPRAVEPADVVVPPGSVCVGDGAVKYRAVLREQGADVPPDDSPLHAPRASLHASLAASFGAAATVLPVYVREPDAVKWSG